MDPEPAAVAAAAAAVFVKCELESPPEDAAACHGAAKRGVGRLVDSTQADDRRMIYLVRERPLLYARSNLPVASYHSQVKRLWREVADIMGWTGAARYRSQWYAYKCFQFLADRQCMLCTTPHKEGDEECDSDVKMEPEPEPAPAPEELVRRGGRQPGRLRRRRPVRPSAVASRPRRGAAGPRAGGARGEAAEETSRDPHLAFGLFVASELRKYDSRTLARVKRDICQLIFAADAERAADTADAADAASLVFVMKEEPEEGGDSAAE